MKLENTVKEKKREITRNKERREENMLPVPLAGVGHPRTNSETSAGQKTKQESRTMSCVWHRTYLNYASWIGTRTKKRTRVSKSCTVGLLHQPDGFSMNTHAGRTNGESLKHLHV